MVEKRDDNIQHSERDKLMTLVNNERIPSPRPYDFLIDEFVPQLFNNDEDQIYIIKINIKPNHVTLCCINLQTISFIHKKSKFFKSTII